MGASPRHVLQGLLKPHLPKKWALKPWMANLDVLSVPTVLFHLTTIEKASAAPLGAYSVTVTVYVVTPSEGGEAAEDDTDDLFFEFLKALDAAKIPWTRAEKGPFSESTTNLAWAFTIPLTTEKED